MLLKQEQQRLEKLLKGRSVVHIRRRRRNEVVIEFKGTTRLFIDGSSNGKLEFSVTGTGKV